MSGSPLGLPSGPWHRLVSYVDEWYVVPVDRIGEWTEWVNLDPWDEKSRDAPEWAVRVGGSPGEVTFGPFTVWGKTYCSCPASPPG